MCFHYLGNDSRVDGLVNFEKLRMIAKEIRQVVRMTSANMDPAVMFRQRCALYSRIEGVWAGWGPGAVCASVPLCFMV